MCECVSGWYAECTYYSDFEFLDPIYHILDDLVHGSVFWDKKNEIYGSIVIAK